MKSAQVKDYREYTNGNIEGHHRAAENLESTDIGSANSMEAVKELLLEGQAQNLREDGLLISYQQYQTI